MKRFSYRLVFAGLVICMPACDPVRSEAVTALGGEATNVRPGPTHRPGQPCLLCHDGALGDPVEFSVAGTVFETADDEQAAVGAHVTLTDATGTIKNQTTNAAGNFYIEAQNWRPTYPLQVSVAFDSLTVDMKTNIGRDGACASCHVDPTGPASPGHVYATPIDAGVMP
jgi:hypothetical protein